MIKAIVMIVCVAYMALVGLPVSIASNDSEKRYSKTSEWSEVDNSVNISQYVYHDRNRNGEYDLGDIAMSFALVLLEKQLDDGSYKTIRRARSNSAGFANFVTWGHKIAKKADTPINTPGKYRFSVLVPPGWQATSVSSQVVTFTSRPDTRSQLFLEDWLIPVGLAPQLAISGSVANGVVRLLDAEGNELAQQTPAIDGQFRFNVASGSYKLVVNNAYTNVVVDNLPVHIGQLDNRSEPRGESATATFEDLPKHGLYKLPDGYLGLKWRDINALNRSYSQGTNRGYVNGVVSGNYVAYTSQARYGEILSEQPFDFNSVYLSIAWPEAHGQTAIIEMWRGDERVVVDRLELSVLGPIKYAPNVHDVTRVRISPEHGWQIVLEDLTISSCQSFWCRLVN